MSDTSITFTEYNPKASMATNDRVGRLPFPLHALGSLREPVLELWKNTQAAPEICFASFFSAINHAVQGLVNIQRPHSTKSIPASCFFLTIAESGERKTTCTNITNTAANTYQERLMKSYEQDIKSYKNLSYLYEHEKKVISTSKVSQEIKRQKILALENPKKPLFPLLLISNFTIQGLHRLFVEGFPSISLSASEGGIFLGGYAMSKENQLYTLTVLSALWDGQPIDLTRKEGTSIYINNRRLSLHLGLQPILFDVFIKKMFVEGQGFLSRCFMAKPVSRMGTRFFIIPCAPFCEAYHDQILKLYEKTQINEEGLVLKTLTVHPDAIQLLDAFYSYGEMNTTEEGVFYDIRSFVSKSVEHVLRVSATLTIYDNPDADQVPLDKITSSIEIVRFYMSEYLHLFNKSYTLKDQNVEKLLAWLCKRFSPEDEIDRVYLLRSGPPKFRGKAMLDPLLGQLEDRGFIQRTALNKWRLSNQAKAYEDPKPVEFPPFTGKETMEVKP